MAVVHLLCPRPESKDWALRTNKTDERSCPVEVFSVCLLQQREFISDQEVPDDDGSAGMPASKTSTVRAVKGINQPANIHSNKLLCFTEKTLFSSLFKDAPRREITA